jgi:hypothetical protein
MLYCSRYWSWNVRRGVHEAFRHVDDWMRAVEVVPWTSLTLFMFLTARRVASTRNASALCEVKDLGYIEPEPGIDQMNFALRRDVLEEIVIFPRSLVPSRAIASFGPRFRRTRYDFDDCKALPEFTPLYEHPRGPIEYIEYRDLGIFLEMDQTRPLIRTIRYLLKPPGQRKSQCGGVGNLGLAVP